MLTRSTEERLDEAPPDLTVERLDLAVDFAPTPIEVLPEGWKVYRGTAAFGDVVLDYTQEYGTRELVPADEALSPRAIDTLVGRPLTLGHPPRNLDLKTAREWIRGTVKSAERNDEGPTPRLVVDVLVMDEEADAIISSGLIRELSLGRRVKRELRPGTFNGQRYDARQYDFTYNHLACVPKGRSKTPSGEAARFDEDTNMETIEITLPDGTKVTVPKAVAEHLEKLQAELKESASAAPADGKAPGDAPAAAPPAATPGEAPERQDAALDARIAAGVAKALKPFADRLDAMPQAIRGELATYSQIRTVAEPILKEAGVEHRFDGDAFAAKAEVCKAVFGEDDEDVAKAAKATDVAVMDGLFKAAVREHKRRGDTTAKQLDGLVPPKGKAAERQDGAAPNAGVGLTELVPGFFPPKA